MSWLPEDREAVFQRQKTPKAPLRNIASETDPNSIASI